MLLPILGSSRGSFRSSFLTGPPAIAHVSTLVPAHDTRSEGEDFDGRDTNYREETIESSLTKPAASSESVMTRRLARYFAIVPSVLK